MSCMERFGNVWTTEINYYSFPLEGIVSTVAFILSMDLWQQNARQNLLRNTEIKEWSYATASHNILVKLNLEKLKSLKEIPLQP